MGLGYAPPSLPDGTPPPAPLPAPPGCLWGAACSGWVGTAPPCPCPRCTVMQGEEGEELGAFRVWRGRRPHVTSPGDIPASWHQASCSSLLAPATALVPCAQLPPASVPSPASGRAAGSGARSWYGSCQPGSCRRSPWHSSGMAGGADGRTAGRAIRGAAGRNRPLVQTEAFTGRGAAQLWLARMRTISCR